MLFWTFSAPLDQNWSDESQNQREYIATIDQRGPGKTKDTVWEVRLHPPKFLQQIPGIKTLC